MTLDPEFAYSSQAPAPAGSLFETFADKVLRRVDDVVAGRDCQWPTKEPQRRLLTLLRPHQGKRRSVPLKVVAERMHMNDRTIKKLVQELRAYPFGILIGASRDAEGGGYYLVATEAESDETIMQMWNQAIAMLRGALQMRHGRQTAAQMAAQIELELKEVA